MIDLKDLKAEIEAMTPRKKLFKVLKEGLSALGYWRNKPRGDPKKGYKAMKEGKNVN